jgi:hypothetical protein
MPSRRIRAKNLVEHNADEKRGCKNREYCLAMVERNHYGVVVRKYFMD